MSARTPVHSPARTPEALNAILEDALSRGDLDTFIDAYEDDAALVVPPDGREVQGREQIRAATAPMFSLQQPRMASVVHQVLRTDELALIHARWDIAGIGPDGDRVALNGRGTIVSRRRPDGTWRIVLDNPLSP